MIIYDERSPLLNIFAAVVYYRDVLDHPSCGFLLLKTQEFYRGCLIKEASWEIKGIRSDRAFGFFWGGGEEAFT